MDETNAPCKRCLLYELPDGGLYNNMLEIIGALPEEQKTPPDLYERRLSVCKACDKLVNGMCALCGCFVELRAAKINQRCPDANLNWGGL